MTGRILSYILFASLMLALSSLLFWGAPKDFPVGTVANIKEGASLRRVSLHLKENNFIRSRTAFETFVIIFGGEKHLMSGDYLFEKKIPAYEVARRLSKGERNLAPIVVTIPEGFNVSDIAEVFSAKLANFSKEEFLEKAEKFEGYLFPDTYFFLTTDGEEEVLRSLADNFEKKINFLKTRIVSSGRNENDIMVMASIIEKEAKGDSDRAFISGILWRRIAIGMPLQVDAEPKTYESAGLPEHPICNPGLKAIEASLNPKSSPYLYYLHDKEGSIHFAKSFAEHQRNIDKYLK